MELNGKWVFVTGATGFIGGRLVDKLTIEHNCRVRALVRDFRSAYWLNRTSADFFHGDLRDGEILEQALQGCEVVFHCAAYAASDEAVAYHINVEGTRNLLEAAHRAGVKKFVHISSAAVHNPGIDGSKINEDSSFVENEADVYARTKLAGEQLALSFANERELHVTVLRPTIVFGPRASLWTIDYAQRLLKDQIALSKAIQGTHNFVYVDDVVQALLLAAQVSIPSGEAFIVGADNSRSWLEYLELYAAVVGRPLQQWPLSALKASAIAFGILDSWIERLRVQPATWKGPLIFGLRGARRILRPLRRLNSWELDFYRERHEYSIEKAKRLLGYQPATDLNSVMHDIADWLRAQGYLPSSDRQEAYGD